MSSVSQVICLFCLWFCMLLWNMKHGMITCEFQYVIGFRSLDWLLWLSHALYYLVYVLLYCDQGKHTGMVLVSFNQLSNRHPFKDISSLFQSARLCPSVGWRGVRRWGAPCLCTAGPPRGPLLWPTSGRERSEDPYPLQLHRVSAPSTESQVQAHHAINANTTSGLLLLQMLQLLLYHNCN